MNPGHAVEPGPARVGPYLLERRLGAGGMGAVWRAWDERLKRPVAVKQVLPERIDHPGARRRLRHEAAAAARLNHPAIVHVYDIFDDGDAEWIVMELVEGETLEGVLAAGPLPLPQAVRLGREIAKGLGKAHLQGIVHRDLKTANVMVTPGGHAKILDFGIAKLVESGDPDSTVTSAGSLVGTPHAMAPEQVLGQPVDHRSDLFSFGSLLYEMLTGVSPFRTDSAVTTLGRVCTWRQLPVRQLLPEAPPELSELVDWLLEKEPALRPDDAREVAAILNALLTRLPEAPEPSGEWRLASLRDRVRPVGLDGGTGDLALAPTLDLSPAAVPPARWPGAGAALPLVGREGELDILRQRWELAQAGESQVVLISGEAGIGKSRLVAALRDGLREEGEAPPRWLSCYGVAHARSSPFHAVIELVRRTWLRDARSPSGELDLLEELLALHGLPVAEDLPVLAALLSLPLPAGSALPLLTPEARRRRTIEALLNLLLQAAGEQPAILMVEDLHWLDPSSLELVGALLDAIGGASVLLILTLRPELDLPWRHHAGWLQLHLSRLTDDEALRMVARVPGGDALPDEIRRQIAAKSDGVPLYLEELTKGAVEAGASAAVAGLPALLRGSLTARLDRLGRAVRELACLAAVIGRSVPFELLAVLAPLERPELTAELERLVRSELLVRRGSGARLSYAFKHALLQEAACELLPEEDRCQLHELVAETLEERFPETAAAAPELVAQHYAAGGRPEEAIARWLQAGARALARFANEEALEHCHDGLRLAAELPAGPGRDRTELSLLACAARALVVSRGHSDAEVESLFARVRKLGDRLGEMPHELRSLLWSFYAFRGDLGTAWRLAVQRLREAKARGDGLGLALGLQELATLQAALGRPRSALSALARARTLHPPCGESPLHAAETARALCDAGFPDAALREARRALQRAEGHDPYGTAVALQALAWLHGCRREEAEAALHAQWMHDLSWKQGFGALAAHSKLLLSLSSARLAPAEEAVALMGEAIQALDTLRRVHREELHAPLFLSWLAEACAERGMDAEARGLLADAAETAERTGERLGASELDRLEGVLLLHEGARTAAEASFRAALTRARAAGSRWLELRAAVDLARLLRADGRSEDARALLAPLLARFTEGAETADLRAARELV